jgi:integrase
MKIQGEGTIEKRGKNLYRIRFNLGTDPLTGEYRRSPWRTIHGNKEDARKARTIYRQEIERGLRIDADKLTFGQFAQSFMEQRKQQGTFSPETLKHDAGQIRILAPLIGDVLIGDLDVATIKELLARLGKQGKSPGAVKRAYAVLKKILKEAVNQDLILRNPADRVESPKVSKPEIHYLGETEITRLVAALKDYDSDRPQGYIAPVKRGAKISAETLRAIGRGAHVMAIRLLVATGTRRGEALGLAWGYVDFEAGTVRIARQLTPSRMCSPKTERGKRVISLDHGTLEAFRSWKVRQAEYLLSLGITQGAETPVFTSETGDFMDPNNFSRWWRGFCKAYGFEGLKIHDLRHTQATMLIAAGVDIKTVQARLGHERAAFTLDLYAGVIPTKDRQAADIMNGLLSASPPAPAEVVNL